MSIGRTNHTAFAAASEPEPTPKDGDVFVWRKDQRPYLYRSTDATPPDQEYARNEGRWFFGRNVGRRD